MTFKTRGLVIREQKVGESDCVITLLTDKYGVIRVWAHGIFSPKSKNPGARLFCLSDFTIFNSKEKHTLNSSDKIEGFFNLRSNLASMYLCSYFCEVLFSLLDENSETGDILSLALNCFHLLCEGKKDPVLVKACFEMRLASLLGYTPSVFECERCGKTEFSPSDAFFLDLKNGTLHCSECSPATQYSYTVSPAVLQAIRHIIESEPDRLFSFSLGEDSMRALDEITEKYLMIQSARAFPTLDYYKGIR